MMWLSLLLILAGSGDGTRTNKVEVWLTCAGPGPLPAASIVVKGVDHPYPLKRKETSYEQDLPLKVVIFAGTRAVLHLRGRRTECQKPLGMTEDDVAQYEFNVCWGKSHDLVIVPAPGEVTARYERRTKGEPPDCMVRGTLSGETTVEDVVSNEGVVLQFGSAKPNSPGLNVDNIQWPKPPAAPGRSQKPSVRRPEGKSEALTVEGRTLDRIQIQAELMRQQTVTTGYLASIYDDVSGTSLEHVTSLRFQVKDPSQ